MNGRRDFSISLLQVTNFYNLIITRKQSNSLAHDKIPHIKGGTIVRERTQKCQMIIEALLRTINMMQHNIHLFTFITRRHICLSRQKKTRSTDCHKLLNIFSDLNLLDWSCNNHLAVALGGFVYIWDAGTGSIQQLCQMDSPECYVGSVSWIKEGRYLGIGDSDGSVQV